jgi:hypothetical protein
MYCPNCGKTNIAGQKFCRLCGLRLEKIAQAIAEQLPAEEVGKPLQDRQRRVERWLHIVAGSTVSLVIGGVIWGILYEIILVKGEVLAGSLFLSFVVGLLLFAGLAVYRDSLLKASGKRQVTPQKMLQVEETANLLPESFSDVKPSVTERTTELLSEENGPTGGELGRLRDG